MNFTLVLETLELAWRVRLGKSLNIWRRDLGEARVKTKAALFKGAHLLEAKRHVMHSALYKESITCVTLEH